MSAVPAARGEEPMMLSGLRVLLAEDNPTNQLVATQMLEWLGAEVTLAVDGAQALDIVRGAAFDVLLVDIEMPRVNGIEVIRTLRAEQGPLSRVPMIALTAYVMREHRAAIDAAGADGVIAKPILSIEQFGSDVRRFMRRRPGGEPARAGGSSDAARTVIDQDVFDGLADAIGPEAMSELLEKVATDVQSARGRLERALGGPDLAEMRAATHILISVAGAVGATRVQGIARSMNAGSHSGTPTGLKEAGDRLLAEIAALLDDLSLRQGGTAPA